MSQPKTFNSEAMVDLLAIEADGEAGLVSSLISDYIGKHAQLLSQIETAITSRQMKDIELHAHSLKSSSRLLGLDEVSLICEEIEHGAHRGVEVGERWGLLTNAMERGIRELEVYQKTLDV